MSRTRARQIAAKFIQQNDPTGWFEELYSQAKGNSQEIPWANLTVNPNLAQWLDANHIQGDEQTALVIGSGLGDDAEALSKIGFEVTGLDIAPSAIAWSQKRFPTSKVKYVVADALKFEKTWENKFNFILESYTLQSVPDYIRQQIMKNIIKYLRPLGTLLVICRGREITEEVNDLPYPLTKEELILFEDLGLNKIIFEDYIDQENSLVRRFRIQYTKY
ncbi:MAG: class I SAM-dependent methyltransferase [Xenococcus sp. MO_188.B8]|nr:class I SAM-dependent methyltransferase [Xenococcus sp. MO_188.B8]